MSSTKNLELKQTAFLNKSNSKFIEEMYMKFVNNDPTYPIVGKIILKKLEKILMLLLKKLMDHHGVLLKNFP